MSRKGSQKQHSDNGERWLLTYADLITLLMVFFIVLYSISKADASKFSQLGSSMQQAFNTGVLEGASKAHSFSSSQEAASRNAAQDAGFVEAVIKQVSMPESMQAIRQNLGRERALERDLEAINGTLKSFASDFEPDGAVSVYRNREGITISIWGNILFDSGKAAINTSSSPVLQSIAGLLVRTPNQVRVEGHTDNIPINTALYASNWELSAARATSVVRYLASLGISAKRIGAVGYGEFRPMSANDSRQHRARNRRVDIVILYPEAPPLLPNLSNSGATQGNGNPL